jgi:hypothetical protein
MSTTTPRRSHEPGRRSLGPFPPPIGATREEAAGRDCAVRRVRGGGQHARRCRGHEEPDDGERPAGLFIDTSTPDGKATGLVRDSVVSCLLLVTVYADTVAQVLGTLSPTMKQKLNVCLKTALELP